jgi:anti-anti-sigma regulatory factor
MSEQESTERPQGRLTIDVVEQLRQSAIGAGGRLDLREVTSCDLSAIQLIVAIQSARPVKGRAKRVQLSPSVADQLQHLGIKL